MLSKFINDESGQGITEYGGHFGFRSNLSCRRIWYHQGRPF